MPPNDCFSFLNIDPNFLLFPQKWTSICDNFWRFCQFRPSRPDTQDFFAPVMLIYVAGSYIWTLNGTIFDLQPNVCDVTLFWHVFFDFWPNSGGYGPRDRHGWIRLEISCRTVWSRNSGLSRRPVSCQVVSYVRFVRKSEILEPPGGRRRHGAGVSGDSVKLHFWLKNAILPGEFEHFEKSSVRRPKDEVLFKFHLWNLTNFRSMSKFRICEE